MPTVVELAQVLGTETNSNLLMGVIAKLPVIQAFDAAEITTDRIFSIGVVGLPSGQFLNIGEGYTDMQTATALAEYNASRIGGAVKTHVSTEERWNKYNRAAIGAGLEMDYRGIKTMGAVLGQLRHVQSQIFRGTTNDAKGFPGLKGLTPYVSGNVHTTTETPADSGWERSVLNAGGSTSSTASSIYGVKYGPQDCQICIGGPGGLANFLNFPAPTRQWLEAADPVDGVTKGDWYDVSSSEGYIGLRVSGGNEAHASRKFPQFSVRRVANVTAQAGYTCTDSLLQKLCDMFPDGRPDAIFYSFRSRSQLQSSRTPTSTVYVGGVLPANAASNQAPIPTDFYGIPLIATDAIGNTDAIES